MFQVVCKSSSLQAVYRNYFSVIKQKNKQKSEIALIENTYPGFNSYTSNYYLKKVIKDKQLKYFPLYLCKMQNKFCFYQAILKRKYGFIRHRKFYKNSSLQNKQPYLEQSNDKNSMSVKTILSIIVSSFFIMVLMKNPNLNDKNQTNQPKNSSRQTNNRLIDYVGQSYLNSYINFNKQFQVLKSNKDQILKQIFHGLQQIDIQEYSKISSMFKLKLKYEGEVEKQIEYAGNINDFMKLVENYQQDSMKKIKIYKNSREYKPYSIRQAISDTFGLLSPFIGIAISYYIFKKTSPDSILSAISPKKSFKFTGIKDIKVKFKDVAGMEQAKKEITEFVDFLKHGQKYRQIGAHIPKGALLTGPPGTGKTMLAKACAGEAGVSFFYLSGSQFLEIFVGVGASKVRQLFKTAREQAPSIIFIDEIDAIGKKRQTSRNEQKDSTLNQLLVQMDGFSSHETVIVMAATNRKDVLDSALTRPGRFDRLVEVNLPQIKDREEIFLVHLRPLKIDPSKDLKDIAKRLSELTPGFSGADIANLCNQAAIIATRRNKTFVEDKDFEDASERITAGYEKKNLMNPQIKKRVAYHQAGHAVSGWFLKGGDPLVKLTIIPRSKGSLGYAQYLPKSSYIKSRDDLVDRIAILLGGITSEQIFFGNMSSGGSDDLQKTYQVARQMVATYGMGKQTYNITVDESAYVKKESQYLLRKVDEEMNQIIKEGKQKCKKILTQNKKIIEALADELINKQTINTEDIKRIMGERPSFC